MDINYWGAVHMTFYALPHLKQKHGKIVVISSITGAYLKMEAIDQFFEPFLY